MQIIKIPRICKTNKRIAPQLEITQPDGDSTPPSNAGPNATHYVSALLNSTYLSQPPSIFHAENSTLITDSNDGLIGSSGFKNQFPFPNVAVMTPSGIQSDLLYIYHQMNESAFREETWNGDASSWISTTIAVDTST